MKQRIYLSHDVNHDTGLVEKLLEDIREYCLDWLIVDMTRACDMAEEVIIQAIKGSDLVIFLCGYETIDCPAINKAYDVCLDLGKTYFFLNGYNDPSVTLPKKAYPSAVSYLWKSDNFHLLDQKFQTKAQ